jgi:hypothetical protein
LLPLLACLAAAVGFAPAPFPRPDRRADDRQRLDGVWEVKAITSRGLICVGIPGFAGVTFNLFRQDRVALAGGELRFQNRLYKFPYPSEPVAFRIGKAGQFDLAPEPGAPPSVPALYRLEDATLTLCFPADAGKGRPASFEGREHVVIVLERRGGP